MNVFDIIIQLIFAMARLFLSIFDKKHIIKDHEVTQYNVDELNVVFVRNECFKKTSLRLIVDAGCNYDTKKVQGLAHLCEHLIFYNPIQSEKSYALTQYVKNHSGFVNAYTEAETIVFEFQISDAYLFTLSKLFANSIANPLFDTARCINEADVIEHEYRKNFNDFGYRFDTLIKQTFDESVPESFFGCGNRQTLKLHNISSIVREFHTNYFTKNRMKLLIVSKLPLDELMSVADFFSIIPNGKKKEIQGPENDFNAKYEVQTLNTVQDAPVLKAEYKGSIIQLENSQSSRTMLIYINVPSKYSQYTDRFKDYLEFVFRNDLGYLTPEISYIKSFVLNINIFMDVNLRSSLLIFEISLINISKPIIDAVLQYMHTYLHSLVPNKDIYDFLRNKETLLYKQPRSDCETALEYVEMLRLEQAPDHKAFKTEFKFDEGRLSNFISYICDTDNWLVFHFTSFDSPDFDRIEPWFKTKFSVSDKIKLVNDYTKDKVKKSELMEMIEKLPAKRLPQLIVNSEMLTFQYKLQDLRKKELTQIKMPAGEIAFLAMPNKSPICQIEISIDFLLPHNQILFGLHFKSIMLQQIVETLNAKFTQCYVYHIANESISDQSIIIIGKQSDIRNLIYFIRSELLNYINVLSRTYSYAYVSAQRNLDTVIDLTFPIQQCLDVFRSVIRSDINEFESNDYLLQDKYLLEIRAYGNITEKEVVEMYKILSCENYQSKNEISVKNGKRIKYASSRKKENAIVLAFYLGNIQNAKSFIFGEILEAIFDPFLVHKTRMKAQLAYIQFVKHEQINKDSFLVFLLQSTSDLQRLEAQVFKIAQRYRSKLSKLKPQTLQEIKDTIKEKYFDIFDSLTYEGQYVKFAHIFNMKSLNLKEVFNDTLQSVTIEDLLELDLKEMQPIIIHTE